MPPWGPPTEQEIRKIARRTIDIIQSNITMNVCLFGSAASFLWTDIGRVPNVCHATLIHPSILCRLKRIGVQSTGRRYRCLGIPG